MEVRIAEGVEPPHFLQIFQGKLIIFQGKSSDYDMGSIGHPSTYLLRITGDTTFNSKAVQVSGKSVFTSKDCLVLKSASDDVWVWCGQSSTGDTREIAKSIGAMVTGEYQLALECNEPDEFWICLPDRIESKLRMAHATASATADQLPPNLNAAMNRCALYIVNALNPNQIALRELMAYEQSDLSPEDMFLMDLGGCIYVWCGNLWLVSLRVYVGDTYFYCIKIYYSFFR